MSWIRGITFIALAAIASMGGCGRPSRTTAQRSSASERYRESFPQAGIYTLDNLDLENINSGKAGKNFRDLTWEDVAAYFHGTKELASDLRALNGNKGRPVELRGSHHEAACRADEALGGEENPFCFIPDIKIGTTKAMSRREIAQSLPIRPGKRGPSRAKSSQVAKGSGGAKRVSAPRYHFAPAYIREGNRMGHWTAVVRNVSGSSLEGAQIDVIPNTRALIVNGVSQSGRNLRLNLYYAYSGQISLTIMVNGTQAGQVQFTIPEPAEEN